MEDLLEYISNSFLYIWNMPCNMPWNMISCTPINIGSPYNLYSAVDSRFVSSWLFAPPHWKGLFHVNLCVYFIF
jgi:hypothetical protein